MVVYFGLVFQLKSRIPLAFAIHATATRRTSRKSLIPHDPPKHPWSHVAADLFLVRLLWAESTTNASTVITSFKSQFARHGILDMLYSDNGLQFSSRVPRICIRLAIWRLNVITPLPPVKWKDRTCHQVSKETTNQGEGKQPRPYLSILDWRNMPSACIETSPVQRLFGRQTKTRLLMARKLLQPKIVESTEKKLKERKSNQVHYYNGGTKELVDLQSGDTMHMRSLLTDRNCRRKQL